MRVVVENKDTGYIEFTTLLYSCKTYCVQAAVVDDDGDRKLIRMHDIIQQLPPPHHR